MKAIKGISFLLFFLFSATFYGNHVLGGNFSVDCLGGSTYGITLTYYKDCFGATTTPAFELVNFNATAGGCGAFSTNLIFVTESEVSDMCPSELANNSCNGGFTPGTFQVEYYLEIDLDPTCIWEVTWESGDWNYFINMDNSTLPTSNIVTQIDPGSPCLELPTITSTPVPYVCIGDAVSHTIGVDNPGAYDLEFYFSEALTIGNVSAPYEAGYTAAEPIPGILMDNLTGEITFTAPGTFGNYVVGVEVQMFELGVYVGSFYEYLAFVVRPCGSLTTFDTDTVLNPHPDMMMVDANEYNVCVGDSLCFDVLAENTNNDRLLDITYDDLGVFTGALFETQLDNPALASFCVEIDGTMTGTHIITFNAIDDACVQNSEDEIEVIINVSPTADVSVIDTLICAGSPLTLDVIGDVSFTWNVTLPDVDPGFVQGANTQTFVPAESMEVEVIADNAEVFCNASQLININVSLYDIDTTIVHETCVLDNGSIDVTPIGGSGTYAYNWDIPAATEDVSGLSGGMYSVTITDTGSAEMCEVTEVYEVEGVTLPTANITGDVTICENDCHDITFNLTGVGPFTVNLVNMTTGVSEATGVVNDQDTWEVCPTETTTYQIQLVSDSNVPACTDATTSDVTVTVLPEVTATFLPTVPVCAGSDGSLEVSIDQAGTFDVNTSFGDFVWSDGDVISPVPVPDLTTYFTINSISYQGALTCTNSEPHLDSIVQIALPTGVISGDTTMCMGDLTGAFDLELTGVGPWEIDYEIIGDAVGVVDDQLVLDAVSEIMIGLTAAPTTQDYCLTYVVDLGSGCEQALDDCANVVIDPLPTVTYLGDPEYSICPGETVGPVVGLLEPSSDGDGNPYEFDIILEILPLSGGVIDSVIQDVNAFNFIFAPEETSTYHFINIVDSNSLAFCSAPIDEFVDIIVYELPESTTTLDTICDPAGESYQVVFDVFGGQVADYDISGQFFDTGGLGVLAGNQYTSGPIPSGFGETWTINDGDPCSQISLTISAYTCPIATYSGTIDEVLTVDSICSNGIYCIEANGDEVLDPNDVLSFALLDGPDFATASVIQIQDGNCWDLSTIGFPPLEYNVPYYGVVIAGNDDGTGLVDLTHPNISVSDPVTLEIFDIPTATVTGGAIICEGDTANVQVNLTGVGPWTFEILQDGLLDSLVTDYNDPLFVYEVTEGQDYTTTNLVNEVCAVGVSDGMGVVIVNPLPEVILSADGSICEGDTYDIDIEFTAGTPNFNGVLTYEDDDGVTTDIPLPADIAVLMTSYTASDDGLYYISEMMDGNGCNIADTTDAIDLTVFDLPTAELLSGDTSFCAGSILDLDVIFTGLQDFTFEYNFDADPSIIEVVSNDTLTLNIGAEGNLNLINLTDGNGCVSDLTGGASIFIEELVTPIADAGPDLSVCSEVDAIIGSAEVVPFDYLWTGDVNILNDDTIAEPTVNIENAVEGMDDLYNLVLTVSNGQCFDTDDVAVTVLWEPTIDAGIDANVCNGDTYQLNGEGGISCQWIPDLSFLDPDDICNPNVMPTDTTMYYLTVEGANGCFNTDSIQLFVPEVLDFIVDFDADVCFGVCDGNIDITPEGGFGTYGVTWVDPTLTDLSESDLCPAVYDFTVTDAEGCQAPGSVTINELAEYFLDDVVVTQPTCFNGNNGSIQVISATGVEYFIDIPDSNLTGIFDQIAVGMYTVSAANSIGCLATEMVDVTSISDEITFGLSTDVVVVCYQEPHDITADALGGDGAFVYSWYDCLPAPPCLIENAVTTTVIPEEDTEIWAVAIDGNGCSSDTLMASVNLAPELFIDASIQDEIEICQGECIELEATASGGDGAPTLTWFVVTPSSELGSDPVYEVCPLEDISYVAVADDGCSAPTEYQVDVTVFETANVEIFVDGENGCYPVTVEFQNLTDPDLQFECEWNFGDGNTQPICTEIEYTYFLPGVYYPSLSVTSENGCTGVTTLEEPIFVYDYPTADFTWTPEEVSTIKNEVDFINLTSGASTYDWDIGGFIQSNEIQPSVTLPTTGETLYEICLIAASDQLCADTICKPLFVNGDVLVYVPSAFTPDFDGVNDIFKPMVSGVDPGNYSFKIFDRWDNLIFETTDIEGYWIGDNNNGEHFVDHDVYVYQIVVRDPATEEEIEFVGHVTILR